MIANIQVLRAAAAYMVLLYHAQVIVTRVDASVPAFEFGAAGVDIFFVISGFIMVWTTRMGDRGPAAFLRDRALRVYPAYWVVTAVLVVLSLAGLRPAGLTDWDLGDLVTSILLVPDVRRDGLPSPILGVGWTLVFEVWFYLLFAATLVLRDRTKAVLGLAVAMAALVVVNRLARPDLFVLTTYTSPLLLEFVAGMLLGLLHARTVRNPAARRRWPGLLLIGGGLLAMTAAEAAFGDAVTTDPMLRILGFGLPAAAIVRGALLLECAGMRPRGRFLIGQGEASYALYLTHLLTLHAVSKVAGHLVPDGGPAAAIAVGLVGMAAAGVAATLFHTRIEAPMIRALRRPAAGSGTARPRAVPLAG